MSAPTGCVGHSIVSISILAPSSALRDVIVANGVDPDRVIIDENHVADEVAATVPTTADAGRDRRTLPYGSCTSGAQPLKGADVILREAARRLDQAGDAGWRADAYGLDAIPVAPTPDRSRCSPPFDAADVVDVLAGHDVLVLPSLARESFSIAAREALAAGLAVITSDCLGPEEVVIDGVNGIVVPTGDAGALADAMRSLVDDRVVLRRLRERAATQPVTLRTAADHLTALLEIYAATPSTCASPARRLVGFVVGDDGEAARYRVHHAREALMLAGNDPGPLVHHLDPGIRESMAGCDVVLLQQVPATAPMIASIESWRADGALVVFDLADDTGLDAIPIAACDGVVARTPELAQRRNRVDGCRCSGGGRRRRPRRTAARRTVPSGASRSSPPSQPLRVGVREQFPHPSQADLDLIEPVLVELLQRQRPEFEFI